MFESRASKWAGALLVLVLFLPLLTAAAGIPKQIVPENCNSIGGCTSLCDFANGAQNLLNTGIYLAVFMSAIFFAWAGWLHITAGGESGKIGEARKIFANVLIGLILMLAAWLIVDTIMKVLFNEGAGINPGPWNQVC